MQGAILQGSGNFDSMIRNVITNVLLPATVIFITDNLSPWFNFGSLILSPKILYGNECDGKMALFSAKIHSFIFPPLVFASLHF